MGDACATRTFSPRWRGACVRGHSVAADPHGRSVTGQSNDQRPGAECLRGASERAALGRRPRPGRSPRGVRCWLFMRRRNRAPRRIHSPRPRPGAPSGAGDRHDVAQEFTGRPGQHVVCLVVLIVVAREVRVLGADVANGPVLFHVQPPAIGARLAAERSPSLIIRAIEDRRHGCRLVNGFVDETRRDRGDDVERFLIAADIFVPSLQPILPPRRGTPIHRSMTIPLTSNLFVTVQQRNSQELRSCKSVVLRSAGPVVVVSGVEQVVTRPGNAGADRSHRTSAYLGGLRIRQT